MRSVVITGASSGLGRALALHYARERCVLGLLGRDGGRLAHTADECTRLGATVTQASIDVRDRAAMRDWLLRFDEASPADLVIANAGVMAGTPPGGDIEPADAAHALIEANVLGVLNTVQPLLPAMRGRGSGQVAMVSSVAAFVAVPDAPSYSASKAAVLNYGLSLRDLLAPDGVRVSVVCPGYVVTPMMMRESGSKPFALTAERAAALVDGGLRRNRALIVFPSAFGFAARVSGLMPDRLRRWMNRGYRFTVSGA